jgi:hydrogenase expression/formation protein HypC
MCLALSGRIVAITLELPADAGAPCLDQDPDLWRVALVDFGGVRQRVSLACLAGAQLGDQVLVHVGLAIALVEEGEWAK